MKAFIKFDNKFEEVILSEDNEAYTTAAPLFAFIAMYILTPVYFLFIHHS